MTQFNPSGNSTTFPDNVIAEEVSSVPVPALDSLAAAVDSLAAAEDADSLAAGSSVPVPAAVEDADSRAGAWEVNSLAEAVQAVEDDQPAPEVSPLPPSSAPTLPAATRKSKKKTVTVSVPARARKRPRVPTPPTSPEQRSPIPVLNLRLFPNRNAENDEFMKLAKRIRKSRRIAALNKK